MKIAFTYNLKTSNSEEEAEFDTQETVSAIASGLTNLGHQVELIEVSGPPSRLMARLEALSPDLVFNTAEGRHGRFREAVYPGIFEQLGLQFTGSDAYVCTLTLDKHLTKLFLSQFGVPSPKSVLVQNVKQLTKHSMRFPLILKPNFEGSSKGITADSIVHSEERLNEMLAKLLAQYPCGVLVEEFIVGKDVTVPYLEGVNNAAKGVLTPTEYEFDHPWEGDEGYKIYDYNLKNVNSHHVKVVTPARITPEVEKQLTKYSQIVFSQLNIRDLGRADFRVTPQGEVYFIEVNALPSLEPGAGIYLAAAQNGLSTTENVLSAIVESAQKRYQIKTRKRSKRSVRNLRVGFTYNQKRCDPTLADKEAEFDSPKTLGAIREAIASYGHEVIDFEATPNFVHLIAESEIDIVFNIAEGVHGRNRESQIPAVLELYGIPYTGSDAATLSICLDKGLAKRVVREAGVLTPKFFLFSTGKEKIPEGFHFPLIVKPVAEGSSKGVFGTSVAQNEAQLRETAALIINKYQQPALVEEYLPGREFTVALLGESRPRVLPAMEIVFNKVTDALDSEHPIYTYQDKLDYNKKIHYEAPAKLDDRLRREIEKTARQVFIALGCRDVARIDLRLDHDQRVHFIECNPLPGLTPGWSDLCLITQSIGMDYRTLIGEILSPAIRRWKEYHKLLLTSG